MSKLHILSFFYLILWLSGCTATSRYELEDDAHPQIHPDLTHIKPLIPQYEPLSYRGNKAYSVRGLSYQVQTTVSQFSQTGRASWYGKKFHGHETSNGEIYDMYTLSAAHKTLPLPCYVKVENLDNGKELIVRVNDRGPFHEGRIIDLSYAAARKLGVYQTGTAEVKITLIRPDPESLHQGHLYIQVAASQNREQIQKLGNTLSSTIQKTYRLITQGKMIKLQFGPFKTEEQILAPLNKIKSLGYEKSYITYDMMQKS
tara:strand:+ start:12924 stop:13697 length:774 start_codon:yes stop_codon:yes gene_type:complete